MKKKLEATEREWNVKIENKSGTLVLEFTPAPYEVFKQTVKTYYEQGYKSRIRIDENKNRVDESISVFGGKCSSKKSQLFRVNFFNTTSRVTVNGKCLTLFTENDLPKILQELSQISLFTTLNNKIAEACRLGIQSISMSSKHCVKSPDHTQNISTYCSINDSSDILDKQCTLSNETSTASHGAIGNSSPVDSSGQINGDTCPACDGCISLDVQKHILCDECNMLYHVECVTSSNISRRDNDSFICNLCNDNLLYGDASGQVSLDDGTSTDVSITGTLSEQSNLQATPHDTGLIQPKINVLNTPPIATEAHSVVHRLPEHNDACIVIESNTAHTISPNDGTVKVSKTMSPAPLQDGSESGVFVTSKSPSNTMVMKHKITQPTKQKDSKCGNISTKTKTQSRASAEAAIVLDPPNTDNSNSSLHLGQQVDPKYGTCSTKTKTQSGASTEAIIGLDSPNTDNSDSFLHLGQQIDPKYDNLSTKTKTQSRASTEVIIELDTPNTDNSNSSLQLGQQMGCSGPGPNLPRVKKASVRSQARAKHDPQELTQINKQQSDCISDLERRLNEMQQFNQILQKRLNLMENSNIVDSPGGHGGAMGGRVTQGYGDGTAGTTDAGGHHKIGADRDISPLIYQMMMDNKIMENRVRELELKVSIEHAIQVRNLSLQMASIGAMPISLTQMNGPMYNPPSDTRRYPPTSNLGWQFLHPSPISHPSHYPYANHMNRVPQYFPQNNMTVYPQSANVQYYSGADLQFQRMNNAHSFAPYMNPVNHLTGYQGRLNSNSYQPRVLVTPQQHGHHNDNGSHRDMGQGGGISTPQPLNNQNSKIETNVVGTHMPGVHHPHDKVHARPSGCSQSASISEVINVEEYYHDDGASPDVLDSNTPEHEISTFQTLTPRDTRRQDNATPSPLDLANPEGADSGLQSNGKTDHINTSKDPDKSDSSGVGSGQQSFLSIPHTQRRPPEPINSVLPVLTTGRRSM